MAYRQLNEATVAPYLAGLPEMARRFTSFDTLDVREVGDGNLNYVYIVANRESPEETVVVKQVWAAMTPIQSVNNVIALVITVTVLVYFLMTPKYENAPGKIIIQAAQAFLFVLFGAKLASAIPMYVAWASGRVQFILDVFGLL